MSMVYVRTTYGVDVKRGDRVVVNGRNGTVTGATQYVLIRLDGMKFSRPYHPTDPAIAYATREPTQ